VGQGKPTPNYKEKAKDVFDDRPMRQHLLQMSGYQAGRCGFANRRPDGAMIETTDNFHRTTSGPSPRAAGRTVIDSPV